MSEESSTQLPSFEGQRLKNKIMRLQVVSFRQFICRYPRRVAAFAIISLLAISYFITFFLKQDNIYDLVLLSDQSAVCLDGSPGSYYISRKGDPKSFLLVFQEGGWCGDLDIPKTLEYCYQRSKSQYGTSSHLQKTLSGRDMQGIFSEDQRNYFATWTRVKLMYCDGAGHQGYKKDPVQYKHQKIFFRGHNITISQLKSLEDNNLLFSKAENIVVSGFSAGGVAAYMWVNYISSMAKNASISLLADGIFLNQRNVTSVQSSFSTKFKNLFQFSNIQINPPTLQCVQKFNETIFNCMFVENIYMHIQVPIFNVQSLYDTWSIQNILNIKCVSSKYGGSLKKCSAEQRNYIQQYHEKIRQLLLQIFESSQSNGLWAPVCADHCYTGINERYFGADYRVPMNSKYSAAQSIKKWMQKSGNHKHIDSTTWPDNSRCSEK